MIYRCRHCQLTEARGFLPGATCGMLLFFPAAMAAGVLVPLVLRSFPGLGWWWVAAVPLIGVVSLCCSWFLQILLAPLEWLLFRRRRCPGCGSRRWSWGFTQGFGL